MTITGYSVLQVLLFGFLLGFSAALGWWLMSRILVALFGTPPANP